MSEEKRNEAKPNIICLMTDRLHLGYLGAYGNSWIGTPTFDRLAAESVLFDRYYTSSLSLPSLYHAFWTGHEPITAPPEVLAPAPEKKTGFFRRLLGKEKSEVRSGLSAELREAGYRTVLLTDDSRVAELSEATPFDKTHILPPARKIADSEEKTSFFLAMTHAGESVGRLARAETPFFLWVHLKGWEGKWDFPLSLREEAREDEDDPPPYDESEPPFLDESHEPRDFDQERAIAETYAAGVRLWDRSLGELVVPLSKAGVFEKSAFFLGGARGFPLGEHRRVGLSPEKDGLLYFEEIHLPLLYRPPGMGGEAVRTSGLCGPDDLYRTITCLAGWPCERKTLLDLAAEETESIRSHLTVTQADGASLRQGVLTDEWYFLCEGIQQPWRRELYLCPNDRWNVNDVADRCEEELLEELEGKIVPGGFA
ncbi:MAG: sulfatase-like hydrolase/transferase [Thermoguttaceae bacterium]|jgi:arylsulfatase A-like enzyme